MTPPLYTLHQGDSRLLVSVPHAGTHLPPEIAAQLNDHGRAMLDTDWHVDRLYAFAAAAGASVLVATHSRHVVDLNRNPAGGLLYPGQVETGICPTESFAGVALYDQGGPDRAEIDRRVAAYWAPYHAALLGELARIATAHGDAVLLDGHSILGAVPRLFAGALPDLNFGTNGGLAADPALAARAMAATAPFGFSQVLDGRFRGGHITRHYGNPAAGVQAIQLELAQRIYMDEAHPGPFDPQAAARLIGALRALVTALQAA